MIAAASVNVDSGNDDIALFELARIYLPSGEQLPEERWRVGVQQMIGGISTDHHAVDVGLCGLIDEELHAPINLFQSVRCVVQVP